VIITKPVIGTLEIDLDKGVIWLNSVSCVLRICKLKFINKLEKYSSVDITNGNVFMEDNVTENYVYQERIQEIFSKVYLKTLNSKTPDEYLNKIEKLLEEN